MPTAKKKPSSTRVINRATPVRSTRTKTTPKKTSKKTDKKIDIRKFLVDKTQVAKTSVHSNFDDIISKVKYPRKNTKKLTKAERLAERRNKIRGIIGIGLLFVVVSIAYSTYMTNLFVDGSTMIIALTPQVIFAVVTLVIAFYKIYK